jgi:hypothetical protein
MTCTLETRLIPPHPTDAEFWHGNEAEMVSSRRFNEWLHTGKWTKHHALLHENGEQMTLVSDAFDAAKGNGWAEMGALLDTVREVVMKRMYPEQP